MKVSRKIEYIKEWILKYCKSMSNEAKSLVVGVSGGIDSSLIGKLMKDFIEENKSKFSNEDLLFSSKLKK